MRQEVNFGKMIHGGDYNPEQWLDMPEILEKDIEYFKKAKINEVSLGIFAWAKLEPEEGVFDFDWMEKIIDRLYENHAGNTFRRPSQMDGGQVSGGAAGGAGPYPKPVRGTAQSLLYLPGISGKSTDHQ